MGDIGAAFAYYVGMLMVIAFAIGVALMLVLIYVVPWVWHLCKPFLHTVTA